jgi:hypothetical protein
METPVSIALGAAGLALGVALFYAIVVAWKRAMHDDGSPRFFRMLKRQGVASQDLDSALTPEQQGTALRRCALCGAKERCEESLSAAAGEDYRKFCPNAELIEEVKAR